MTNSERRTTPPEVTKAVIELAMICAHHKYMLGPGLELAETVAKQAAIIKTQRETIRRLEKRLGDDEL